MKESSKSADSARPSQEGSLREVTQANTRASDLPVVSSAVTLPEITVKAVILSVVLAAVLAAANAYLGLFAGMTVSASIPAAVASM